MTGSMIAEDHSRRGPDGELADRRRGLNGMARKVAFLVVATLVLLGMLPPSSATYPGTNGPLLVSGPNGLGLVPASGGPFFPLVTASGVWDARFSAQGDQIAYSVYQNDTGVLRVRHATGGDFEIARVPQAHIEQVAWSPDSTSLAFLGSRDGTAAIYRVPVSGGRLTVIKSFTQPGWTNSLSFDWHPTQDLLAVGFGSDVWTMDSTGESVKQWTKECDYPAPLRVDPEFGVECDQDRDGIMRSYTHDRIRWASSGKQLVVPLVRWCGGPDDCPAGTDGRFVATLDVGGAVGKPVTAWPAIADGHFSDLKPVPSPDGTRLAFRDSDGSLITTTAEGKRVASIGRFDPEDWQPCTRGVCPSFRTGTPTSITVVSQLGGSCTPKGCVTAALVASGRLTPVLRGKVVSVTLEAVRRGKWKTVGTKRATLSAASKYQTKFQIPRDATVCRVTASFAGSDTHLPSSARKSYRC